MDALIVLNECQPGLSDELNQAVAKQRLSSRTVHTYQQWIAQYLAYHNLSSPVSLTEQNVRDFLRYILKNLSPSRARFNQAREAIMFLYEKVLQRPLKKSELDVKRF